jgi:DNA repair protein RecN (Recombination protein N)
MLKLLRINNIALVPSLELEFGPGLTLLTGETGAGKSILIDALGLVLGERASPDLIRSGEERAVVEAVVEMKNAGTLLEERALPQEGDEIVLRRELQASGKGRATVNGAIVPVGLLRDLAPHLAVVHGQHEPQGLLDPGTHLSLVDHFAGTDASEVAEVFRELRTAEAGLERLRGDRREAERRREMLEFQANEIEKAELRAGEEEALRAEKARQANAGRLASLSSEAYSLLYDDESAALARLGQVFKRVEELAAIDAEFGPFLAAKVDCLPPLEDLARVLRDYRERLEVSPGRLDEIESRLALLERLKKKYGSSVEEVLAFGARCRGELEALSSPEREEQRLEERRTRASAAYLERARALSKRRRTVARELVRRVQAELAELAMEKTRFEVLFTPADAESVSDPSAWTEQGLERAEFLLSPNPGEELRPLVRIASGGELSRLMLALKSVVRSDRAGMTLVFDEVDAGIGGRVAEVVGRKLRALSERQQVLCVTHLPQIAAFADQHLAVRKQVARGRTATGVDALSERERVEEVARMLGGETITETARQHAQEMLKQSLRR